MAPAHVDIAPDVPQKFIVATVIGTDGNETLCLVGNPNAKWHKDIADALPTIGLTLVEVVGGGRVELSSSEKTIKVWGRSDRYGEVDLTLVRRILEEAFPGYALLSVGEHEIGP